MRRFAGVSFLLLASLLLTACGDLPPDEPAPPGDKTQRGSVWIVQTEIVLLESFPVQVRLHVLGTKPTPCHELAWEVSEPDGESRIAVDLYTLVDPGQVCVEVEEPFDESIPLGDFTQGAYTVWLNETNIGDFSLEGGAMPDPEVGREPVYIDATDVLLMESYPVQVALIVKGHLPTPCHELGWEVSDPDAEGRIEVKLFSSVDPEKVCIQVLEPFEASVPIGNFTEGSFTLWLEGDQIGEFDL